MFTPRRFVGLGSSPIRLWYVKGSQYSERAYRDLSHSDGVRLNRVMFSNVGPPPDARSVDPMETHLLGWLELLHRGLLVLSGLLYCFVSEDRDLDNVSRSEMLGPARR